MKYLTLLLILFCQLSFAQGPRAEFIIPGCENLIDPTTESIPTAGYCAGVINTMMAMSVNSKLMCLPFGIETRTIATHIITIDRRDSIMQRDFISLVIMMLTINYPCQVENSP